MSSEIIKDQFMVTEIEIVYKNPIQLEDRKKIQRPEEAYQLFRDSWDENKIDLVEQFRIMLLDQSCNCLGISLISTGGIAYCHADPRLIFATAIKGRATQIILAHNHPSGNLTPSEEDKRLTTKLVEGGKFLDIKVADHLIVTRNGYFSINSEFGM